VLEFNKYDNYIRPLIYYDSGIFFLSVLFNNVVTELNVWTYRI